VIVVAVRWYLRYGLSYRDVEELLAERGIDVDHITVYRRVQRFTPLPPGSRGRRRATGGSPTRRTSRSGATSTGPSTSVDRSSTCCCRRAEMPQPPGGSSLGHYGR
jgi:hypothetical protein